MQESKKYWFIVNVGSAPVYAKPSFNSACVTEAVHGESCIINSYKENWLEIKCEDGYEGWINSFYGNKSSEKNNPSYLIIYPNEQGNFLNQFPFGSRINKKLPGSVPIDMKLGFEKIISVAENLMGTPYKWGGKTSLGFDCSGFVQSVLKVCGIEVPRDSNQQWDYFHNNKIDIEASEPGDLHFFGINDNITHVGFSTGGRGLLHAQGCVKVESLDSNNGNFNHGLLDIYLSSHSIKRKFQ